MFLLLKDKNCFQILLWLALEAQTEALVDIVLALCCVFSIFRCIEAHRQPAFRLDLQQALSDSFKWKTFLGWQLTVKTLFFDQMIFMLFFHIT